MLIAADIGGTKTVLGIFTRDKGPCTPLFDKTYTSNSFSSFEDIVDEFITSAGVKPDKGIFAVSGPILGMQVRPTNLPWSVGIKKLRNRFNISSVRLINDIAAMAYAVPALDNDNFHSLNEGVETAGGMRAVIAPGTGLGEAFFHKVRGRIKAYASEGGHADFPPTDELTWSLAQHLKEKYHHVSCEQVCSGKGIVNIYEFLRDAGYCEEPEWLKSELSHTRDKSTVIIQTCNDLTRQNELTSTTLELFISQLGAEAGNMALKVMATGGIYLGGGIPRRIVPALAAGPFMKAFTAKGRFADMMSRIPVRIILNEKAALIGTARIGLGLS